MEVKNYDVTVSVNNVEYEFIKTQAKELNITIEEYFKNYGCVESRVYYEKWFYHQFLSEKICSGLISKVDRDQIIRLGERLDDKIEFLSELKGQVVDFMAEIKNDINKSDHLSKNELKI